MCCKQENRANEMIFYDNEPNKVLESSIVNRFFLKSKSKCKYKVHGIYYRNALPEFATYR